MAKAGKQAPMPPIRTKVFGQQPLAAAPLPAIDPANQAAAYDANAAIAYSVDKGAAAQKAKR